MNEDTKKIGDVPGDYKIEMDNIINNIQTEVLKLKKLCQTLPKKNKYIIMKNDEFRAKINFL